MLTAAAPDGEPRAVPPCLGGEHLEALWCGEVEIAGDVHDLVVHEDGEERAAAELGARRG